MIMLAIDYYSLTKKNIYIYISFEYFPSIYILKNSPL